MQTRIVGNTNIEVSNIGLGTVKFGRNQGVHYPATFELPSDDELIHLLETAKNLGINLLDTAPAYGTSEERLGNLIKHQRHDWVISTKVGEEFNNGQSHFEFSSPYIRQSVERSLKRLHTDYLDILFIHSNGDDERIIEAENVFNTLAALKEEGKIRAYGMSTKTVIGGLLTVLMADVVMVTFNPITTQEREVIQCAHQNQKGIFIKKAFASGHLQKMNSDDPITDSLRFIFSEPGVTSVIVGTINAMHLEQNVKAAKLATS